MPTTPRADPAGAFRIGVTGMATTSDRGYGTSHQAERAAWLPVVAAGEAYCHSTRCLLPSRWIEPGTDWDLGHNVKRTAWTGPEHARCNRSDGGRRRHRQRARRDAADRNSRQW